MSLKWHDCPKCGRHHLGRRLLGDSPDSVCGDCFGSDEPGVELTSSHAIRCPHCGEYHSEDLWEIDGLYDEGDTDVTCYGCGKDFPVETCITYTFRSPALGEKELK